MKGASPARAMEGEKRRKARKAGKDVRREMERKRERREKK
jgi:hypothetical protein